MNLQDFFENIDRAQQRVKQLPADFRAPNTSPQLAGAYPGRNATRGYLVGEDQQRLDELLELTTEYVKLNDGSVVQIQYRPMLNRDPLPGSVRITPADPRTIPDPAVSIRSLESAGMWQQNAIRKAMASGTLNKLQQTVQEADDAANAMAQAVTRRIMNQHPEWLERYGVETLMQVIDAVTAGEEDWEEIGSSDVSAFVNMVRDRLADWAGSREEMRDRRPFAESTLNEVTQGVEHSEWADNVKDAYYPAVVRIVKKRSEDGRHVKSQAVANGKLVGQYNVNTGVGTFTNPKKQGVSEAVGESFVDIANNILAGYSGDQIENGYRWTDGKKAIEVEIHPGDAGTVYWALGIVGRKGNVYWVESGSDNPKDALRVVKNFAKHPLPEGVAEGSETAADIDKKIEFHKQGQAAAQYRGSMNKMHAKKIRELLAKKEALMKQGVAEAAGLYGPFTVTINTGERPTSRTKTKKFKREDDAILWAEDWFEDFPQYVYATAEITDPQGNVVWYSDETMAGGQSVTEGVAIVKQDYDLDQMVYVLDVDGEKVSFTYWDYEDDFNNPDIKDIYQQAQEQLGRKLSPEQVKAVARAVFKSFEKGISEGLGLRNLRNTLSGIPKTRYAQDQAAQSTGRRPTPQELARRKQAEKDKKKGVSEMDSQGYRGHRGDEDPGKGPEKSVQPAKAKDVEKDAEKELAKAMDRAHAKKKQQGVAEAGYNPLDDERREQRRMDQERAQFKRDELEAELGGEEQRYRDIMSGTWYILINGRPWQRQGQPVTFQGRAAARRAGQTIKNRDPQKTVTITRELPAAGSQGLAEIQQRLSQQFAAEDVLGDVRQRLGDMIQAKAERRARQMQRRQPPEDVLGEPVRRIDLGDGRVLEIHGDPDDGFRIHMGKRSMPTRFATLGEAEMATRIYEGRLREAFTDQEYAQAMQDYLARGGEIIQEPTRMPRLGTRLRRAGSRHIGKGREARAGQLSGRGANVGGTGKPVVAVEQHSVADPLPEKKDPNLRRTARTSRIMQQLRARYPEAQTDLEALLLDFRSGQRQDRQDINRLDLELDTEEAEIDQLQSQMDRLRSRRGVDEGKKDACYNKVKSRYKVWPSAYASGALVQCRKKGAKNWGEKSQVNEGWRQTLAAMAAAGVMALSNSGAAQAGATDINPNKITATIQIDGQTQQFDLSSQGRDVKEASRWLEQFLDSRGIQGWTASVERGVRGSGNYQRMNIDSLGGAIR